MKKHYKIRVTGRVQGVWYRKHTKAEADRLGVKGFVRNEPDGAVYIEAEATADVLENFVAWCRKGPDAARVEDVLVEEVGLVDFEDFDIRR